MNNWRERENQIVSSSDITFIKEPQRKGHGDGEMAQDGINKGGFDLKVGGSTIQRKRPISK